MNIFTICAFCVITAAISILIYSYSPMFSMITVTAASIILLFFVTSDFSYLIGEIKSIISLSSIDNEYFVIALKALGICYITQFTSEICKDFGQNSIASKIELIGKLFIITLTLPLIKGILNIALELI